MTKNNPTERDLHDLILESCAVVSSDYTGLQNKDEFNAAARHVCDLIMDSILLLRTGSHPRSLFLAVTALEELAKVQIGFARASGMTTSNVKRQKDPLFNHSSKHKIAFNPVLLIGLRLANSLGEDRVREIFSLYADGTYSSLRERALYFSRGNDCLKLPADEVTITLAAEHVLIAIEAFDDYFDCMTREVSEMCVLLNGQYSVVEDVYQRALRSPTDTVNEAIEP